MSETPKQHARRILDALPLDDETRRAFDETLESITEEECRAFVEAYETIVEKDPELLKEIAEEFRRSSSD